MTISEDGFLLRIFVGESDRHGHHPLYEAIALKAREQEYGRYCASRRDGFR
jgi:uncharacterized protein